MNCTTIERLIDEAERPDRLPHEVTGHTAICGSCQRFADERLALRELLVSSRVGAPPYFEVQLKARLAERVTQISRVSWLTPAVYARLGAAAAVLVVAFIVVQRQVTYPPDATSGPTKDLAQVARPELSQPTPIDRTVAKPAPPAIFESSANAVAMQPRRRGVPLQQIQASSDTGIEMVGRSVMWIRSPEREVGMPAISMGAEPIFYANAGQPVRSIPASY